MRRVYGEVGENPLFLLIMELRMVRRAHGKNWGGIHFKHALVALLAITWISPASALPGVRIARSYCPKFLKAGRFDEFMPRIEAKSRMRIADRSRKGRPERRVKFATNIEWKTSQRGGRDESPDPAAPFVLKEGDPRPSGMPLGAYWSNSGKYFYYSPSISAGLRGGTEATQSFEFVFMHRTPDGRIVEQQGGYAAPDSSWGWDGRFEFQELPNGETELVITQGAMELPSKLRGAPPGGADLPEVSKHNNTRSRHVFKIQKFEDGKLYVLDEGSILRNEFDTSGDWIHFEKGKRSDGKEVNVLKGAHGYGENHFPADHDARKIWTDPHGYPVRVFDLVVREVHLRWPDGRFERVPATTRGIAYRMDPRNPSFRVPAGTKLPDGSPADAPIVIASEELPGRPGSFARSTERMRTTQGAEIVEVRTIQPDGTVLVQSGKDFPNGLPITLVEGFNPVPGGAILFPSGKRYFLGMNSASEYTAGGFAKDGQKRYRYGTYLGFREVSEGRLDQYRMVTENTEHGEDFVDFLEDFTEYYGFSWGVGRPQAYPDEYGRWWLDVHGVDTDLLDPELPKTGYPNSHEDFADAYRRHKLHIPIKWVEKNGKPAFEVDDPNVAADLENYRRRKAAVKKP